PPVHRASGGGQPGAGDLAGDRVGGDAAVADRCPAAGARGRVLGQPGTQSGLRAGADRGREDPLRSRWRCHRPGAAGTAPPAGVACGGQVRPPRAVETRPQGSVYVEMSFSYAKQVVWTATAVFGTVGVL